MCTYKLFIMLCSAQHIRSIIVEYCRLNPVVHFYSVTLVLLMIYVVSFMQLEILCHNKNILLCVKGPAFLFVIWGKMGIFHLIEFFSGRCMGNKSSIIKSLLSHTVLLVLWEICLLYLFFFSLQG